MRPYRIWHVVPLRKPHTASPFDQHLHDILSGLECLDSRIFCLWQCKRVYILYFRWLCEVGRIEPNDRKHLHTPLIIESPEIANL